MSCATNLDRRRLLHAAALTLAAPWCRAAEPPLAANTPEARDTRARRWFTDTRMVDQDQRVHAFYSDLVAPRAVLINAVFVGCSSACPLLTQRLVQTRALLGDDFGTRIGFLSITVDPLSDGPAELKRFAQRQGADVAGWHFLTGEPAAVESVLRRLGLWAQTPDAHASTLIAGAARSGRWAKLRPDGTPAALASELRRFIAAAP